MDFSNERIIRLKDEIKERLSSKRYMHTLGVESVAIKLGEAIMPDRVGELRCAALLHDVAKELPQEELLALISTDSRVTNADLVSDAVLHAFAAPKIIERDFPDLASSDILSSVFFHTTADPDMSLFDEIIFVSDYVEPGRKYQECLETGKELFETLRLTGNTDEAVTALHRAAYRELENTVNHLSQKQAKINGRTELALASFAKKINSNNSL